MSISGVHPRTPYLLSPKLRSTKLEAQSGMTTGSPKRPAVQKAFDEDDSLASVCVQHQSLSGIRALQVHYHGGGLESFATEYAHPDLNARQHIGLMA